MSVIRFGIRTDRGRVRTNNEDAVFAQGRVFAVADGMGGAEFGEVASATAVEVVGEWCDRLEALALLLLELVLEMGGASISATGGRWSIQGSSVLIRLKIHPVSVVAPARCSSSRAGLEGLGAAATNSSVAYFDLVKSIIEHGELTCFRRLHCG